MAKERERKRASKKQKKTSIGVIVYKRGWGYTAVQRPGAYNKWFLIASSYLFNGFSPHSKRREKNGGIPKSLFYLLFYLKKKVYL